ncbi:MAG: branched-chain amino acid ABC transporter permease [Actinomycetales bacterium]|nr:branched-chain amino acid ABC transporter permease [Actinomycetales bacterium]
MADDTTPDVPGDALDEPTGGRGIGTDQWVEQHGQRIQRPQDLGGRLIWAWTSLPGWIRWGIPLAFVVLLPFGVQNDYVLRIGINLGLFLLLAYGLNLVVGYANLLDLGFVAFYGFGAYGYAMLSSDQFGVHLPSIIAIPIVVLATAGFGFVLGLPSRRLTGDYLAIATLFFGQMFVVLMVSSDAVQFPWMSEPIDLTGGANGIAGVDQFAFFGFTFNTNISYYFLVLMLVLLIVVATRRIHLSRQGLGWRSLGEDPLAAQHMTVPVARLKLLAFTVGSAIAGLAGCILASVQQGVFPSSFELPLLITIYAALILGGLGSITGVLIGAGIMVVLPEVLRFPDISNLLFFIVLFIALGVMLRSWKLILVELAALVAFTGVMNVLLLALQVPFLTTSEWTSGPLAPVLGAAVFMPEDRVLWGNIAFILLIVAVAGLTTVSRRIRLILLPAITWLAIFTWEVRLMLEPSVTRQLLVGALLVVLMAVRPQGFLGKPRVEVL